MSDNLKALMLGELAQGFAIAREFPTVIDTAKRIPVQSCDFRQQVFTNLTQQAIQAAQPELALQLFFALQGANQNVSIWVQIIAKGGVGATPPARGFTPAPQKSS
jgi:hypothetical protein